MARKKRIWYPGATYHITGRGNDRQDIYNRNRDYEYFLELLMSIQKKLPYYLHAFCLMTNHFHLLLETRNDEIWRIMKPLMQYYTEYYNYYHQHKGHLFESRYKSFIVSDGSYFLQTSRYIHLNPVKANIVLKGEKYRWSSYKTLIGKNQDEIVCVDRTWSYFPAPEYYGYKKFVEGMDE